jgi:tetratricopeptide (TPR) repeat protein
MPLERAPLLTLLALLWLPPWTLAQASTDALIADGHYLRARPLVEAALAKNPGDAHALVEYSVLEWSFSHFDEAIAAAEKAVAAADQSAETHTQLTNALGAKLASSNAGTFEKMSLARRFRREAELSVRLGPKSLDALEDLARYDNEAPSIVGGDKGKARELVERVVAIDPVRGAALKAGYFAGEKDKNRRDSALEALWKAAVAARPESARAHDGLAAVYFGEGPARSALAEEESRRSLALEPLRIASYRQLAVLYATQGRWDDLEAVLKRARVGVPDDLSPSYRAAEAILSGHAMNELSRAERYLRAYLQVPSEGEEPSHAAAHWRLALVLEKQGRRGEAIEELERATREDGTFEEAKKDLRRLRQDGLRLTP